MPRRKPAPDAAKPHEYMYYREITRGPRKGMLVEKTKAELREDRRKREEENERQRASAPRYTPPPVPLNTKLWAWGVNSKKHPTVSVGFFPMIIMYLFVVPILGVLYKLSFGIFFPALFIAAVPFILIARKLKR